SRMMRREAVLAVAFTLQHLPQKRSGPRPTHSDMRWRAFNPLRNLCRPISSLKWWRCFLFTANACNVIHAVSGDPLINPDLLGDLHRTRQPRQFLPDFVIGRVLLFHRKDDFKATRERLALRRIHR